MRTQHYYVVAVEINDDGSMRVTHGDPERIDYTEMFPLGTEVVFDDQTPDGRWERTRTTDDLGRELARRERPAFDVLTRVIE